MSKPDLTQWRRALGPLVRGLVATAVLALVCNLALEATQLTGVHGHVWNGKTPDFAALFLLGAVVLWLLVGLVHAVVGRLWLTTVLAATATAVVAAADYEKVRLRREPVYPGDWEFAENLGLLKDIVGWRTFLVLATAVLLTAVLALTGAYLARSRSRRAVRRPAYPRSRTARVTLRVLTGGLCLLCLGYLAGFNSPGNAARGAYEALGANWRPWSQQRNYLGNGFVGGFLYNLDVPAMTRPADYSAAEMARITARYTQAAERINRGRDPGALDDVNVVMILSESFSDPDALRGVQAADDPIPFTRRLMGATMSGQMLAENIGGGTANMEFEALTGMSMSQLPPQARVPYQMLVPDYDTFPSALRWFEQDGHRTLAIHPFTTEMYRRREVYRTFGFDDFVYDQTMRETRRLGSGGYISDAAAFDEVAWRLETERDPLFVNLVTMQNHIPYPHRYADPATVTGPDGTRLKEIGQYARGLSHSDRALERLVDRLEHSQEKTVVVFYGDHLPGAYPGSVFEANSERTLHQTPFFVWANFPGPEDRQPTTSPIHFMDLVFARAGAAVPPYYALLDELRAEIPAMDGGTLVDGEDRLLRPGRMRGRAARILHDYRLVQYDLSVGRRYSEAAMFAPVDDATSRDARPDRIRPRPRR